MKINKVKLAKGILKSICVIVSLLLIYIWFLIDIKMGFSLLGSSAILALVTWCVVTIYNR